jgi:Fur family ferric uptake transcriptional regulator
MPFSPDAPQLDFSDLDDAIDLLRARGMRVSTSRRIVLEALFAAQEPVSAERIADGLGGRFSRQDVASVYRNLQRFQALGLVRHLHLPHGAGLFVLAVGPPREYLVCDRCDAVTSVDPARLDAIRGEIRDSFGYSVRFSHSPIVGVCARCAEMPQRGAAHRH